MLATAIGFFAASSNAQQRLTRDQLVGTWTLVSCVNAKGNPPPFCVNPSGRAMLDAGGRYMSIIAATGRPKLADADRAKRSAEDYKSVAMGLAANFGTWTFNEAEQSMTTRFETGLFPQNEGNENKSTLTLEGDTLKQVQAGGGVNIWRRVR
jgi:hypothetical protein